MHQDPKLSPIGASLPGAEDTIVALATAPGRGAVAVVRLSGRRAHQVAAAVVSPWPAVAREARLCVVRDGASGEVVDRALVTRFDAPRSYTGENAVEISTHGGYAVPAAVVAALVAAGAREAEPGEFTRRAVLNGKLDVVQAEAVGDLVDARSPAMRRAALAQLDGGLSRRVVALRDAVLEVEALIAYDIDFPEEDDGPLPRTRVTVACDALLGALDALVATAPAGELVREGAVVVIAGAPNVGKSSLFNALVGEARAIVTEVPGTTRDAIEAVVDGGAWPLRLVDTAGLRATDDVVERIGIEVSERYLGRAHAVLACGEDDASLGETVERVRRVTEAPVVAVRTKIDRWSAGGGARGAGGPPHREGSTTGAPAGTESSHPSTHLRGTVVSVSAETGEGLAELRESVARVLAERYGAPPLDAPVVTRERHRRALAEARAEVALFREAWVADALPAPVAAVHLRAAAHALEGLIGVVDREEVLGRLFASFCVGK
ncbi:MAG: tRNA uridine-5-carboxymethylaminomethyl(34) synthesis GTPase MnmE [Gemmatimonadaceae bacterium]